MNKTTILGIVAVAIIGIGITAAYATNIQLKADVTIDGVTELEGILLDTNDDSGTTGQVLSSTGMGTDWINSPASFTQIITSGSTGERYSGSATSNAPFILRVCASNSISTLIDVINFSVNGLGQSTMRIDTTAFSGGCMEMSYESDTTVVVVVSQNDGFTTVFISLQTTNGAIASLTS